MRAWSTGEPSLELSLLALGVLSGVGVLGAVTILGVGGGALGEMLFSVYATLVGGGGSITSLLL